MQIKVNCLCSFISKFPPFLSDFIEKGGLMDVDQEDLMILVPPLFSIKDVPEKVV